MWWKTQDLKLETSSVPLFQEYLRLTIKAIWGSTVPPVFLPRDDGPMQSRIVGLFPSQTAACFLDFESWISKSCNSWNRYDIHGMKWYWLVCQIGGNHRPFDMQWNAESVEQLVDHLPNWLRAADAREFVARTGDGPFEGEDGSVHIGYRLSYAACSGQSLLVSLCHIFLSK